MRRSSIDMSHATPIDIANSESMRTMLARLTQMKQDWEHEKMRLEGERNYLQSAVDQLHQVDRAGHGSGNAREGLSVGDLQLSEEKCNNNSCRNLTRLGGRSQNSKSSFSWSVIGSERSRTREIERSMRRMIFCLTLSGHER